MVDHEEVDSVLGRDGAMDVHGVEVRWNVATFNVQLDVSLTLLLRINLSNN